MNEASPKPEVYWYTLRKPKSTKLTEDLVFDVAIIGGGMAGLMCAQKLKSKNKNLKITVIESSFCGGGASGKSSGFITPDSELELTDLVRNYGKEEGKRIWEFVKGGVASIRETIERRNINCDYSVQDSLFIANTSKGYKKVVEEYAAQHNCGYEAQLYDATTIDQVIGTSQYVGAVHTKNTYGIIAYLYCQDLKDALVRDGIMIYEETPVSEITAAGIKIGERTVTANKVIVCTDHFLPKFNLAKDEIYHAQTFLAVTKPLEESVIKSLFPQGPKMVWDTDLIYQYFRIVEGSRLLMGAASVLYTYANKEKKFSPLILKKMKNYLRKKFPSHTFDFEYFWPGFIGVSKDFLPIVGRDPVMKNVYYAGAGAGLPWAAALGEYLADKVFDHRDDFDTLFDIKRNYPIGHKGQVVLSKPVSFAISHGVKKYFN
ncbi:MAG: FAD-binding oxidoreductase [bacterium]|nr:FAD-binding oxidoreductase [bacterium]